MSRLLELQMEHAQRIGEFIGRLDMLGYKITLGEAYRTKEQAAIYAKKKIGSLNSLHCDRLATDLNLFKSGKYLTKTEEYKEAGELWESMGGSWGGRFSDGNHFSTAFMGRK
jgi:hypothetical protein